MHRLSKLKLKTFKVSFSPTYANWIVNHIATNPAHPLYISQRRRQQEIKKDGLWWHSTNGVDISKSGCVRTWARRRLRQAFVEELKAKGYDETGKLVDATAMQERIDVMNIVRLGRSVNLTGSLRMHGVGPLISAKFVDVKKEVRGIVDALISGAVDTALGFAGEGVKSSGLGPRAGALSQSRKAQGKRPVAAARTPAAPKKKSEAAIEQPRTRPQPSPQAPPRTKTTVGPKKTEAAPKPSRTKPRAVSSEAAPRTRRPSTEHARDRYCV